MLSGLDYSSFPDTSQSDIKCLEVSEKLSEKKKKLSKEISGGSAGTLPHFFLSVKREFQLFSGTLIDNKPVLHHHYHLIG